VRRKRITNHSVVPEKLLNPAVNKSLSRFLVEDKSSLVRNTDLTTTNEREEKEKEESGPKEIRTPDPRHVKAVS
jgi:hypothetical protein